MTRFKIGYYYVIIEEIAIIEDKVYWMSSTRGTINIYLKGSGKMLQCNIDADDGDERKTNNAHNPTELFKKRVEGVLSDLIIDWKRINYKIPPKTQAHSHE